MKKRSPNLAPLQSWAKKRIAEISKESGISEEQIHHDALRIGLPVAREAYYNLVRLRESSEELWNEGLRKNSAEPEREPSQANGTGGESFTEDFTEGQNTGDARPPDVRERSGSETPNTEDPERTLEELELDESHTR